MIEVKGEMRKQINKTYIVLILLATIQITSCDRGQKSVEEKPVPSLDTTHKTLDTITVANFLANTPYVADGDGIKVASFPDGKKALEKFINGNKKTIQIKKHNYVSVNFAVDTTGRPFAFMITSPLEYCDECNTEALRLAKLMPYWIPAYELDDSGNKIKPFVSQQSIKVHF